MNRLGFRSVRTPTDKLRKRKFYETISIDNLSSGIYFVRVGNGKKYEEQKLIINK
ncbi:MAG: T9SS type A sorting domain-containing protein [Chitinophagales bacterium]